MQLYKIVRSKNPGLPRKIGKSSSDLPNNPFGANFAIAKFGIMRDVRKAGMATVANMDMMAITIIISTRVKPLYDSFSFPIEF
ncbi:MAG: hypothetical protein A3F87_03530 [Omnitrophica WOR_2 bacterium RIFCSPLOWO2_12_FULL_51_24]|nr:MAG: hypothetical protein A3F87_03530 [Omnitrophica WOR_2 bacterium RIFCSPLOWO2_12_FULL_51_24]